MGILARNGFATRQQSAAFFSVVFSGQLIYSAFESFKIPFYERLVTYYGLSDTQFGLLFMALGVAVLFYIPGGWVNNRFNVRSLLIAGLLYRCVTSLTMILLIPPFPVMFTIALSWGILDAIFWPAVVKGVVLFSGENNKSMGLGLLTALRAGGEATLNGILIGVMALLGGTMLVFKAGMIVYACLTVPMAYLVHRFVPADSAHASVRGESNGARQADSARGGENGARQADSARGVGTDNRQALAGLMATLRIPTVWLAGLVGLCIYWVYTTLVYTAPYLIRVHAMNADIAPIYTTANAILLGLGGGVVGGWLADRLIRSASKTIFVTLAVSAALLAVLAYVPARPGWMLTAIIIMSCFAFVILMAKGIQQAPIAELALPDTMLGSAMSVNSFMGFACILWAMPVNGMILDAFEGEPATAFRIIFLMMAGVAVIGALSAVWLLRLIKAKR
ncbi:MFS transporter [Schaalia suimastitidis]|uniref:MFS transporter n=1 Tax=Schaalia suimastitidis TaxID=121163 RepID=UPI0003F6E716|nr:MFS transporter [Schaalia suimastitidis]